jgi:hypothetical protein
MLGLNWRRTKGTAYREVPQLVREPRWLRMELALLSSTERETEEAKN